MDNNDYLERNIKGMLLSAQPCLRMSDVSKADIAAKLLEQIEKWEIVKSRIIKIAIAAVITIAALFGIPHWKGSIGGAGTAFAAVKEAMMKMPCVHLIIEGHRGRQEYQREYWLCFESGIQYEKLSDGTISSVNLRSNKKYVYNPSSDKVIVSYYQANDELLKKMDSSDKLLSGFLENFDTWGAKVTVVESRYEGRDVDIYNAQLPETGYSPGVKMTGTMELTADRYNHLPITGKLIGWGADGALLLDVSLAFDYPANEIEDIYTLGVPESAEVVTYVPEEQVNVILDRLDSRVQKGFGNYVAVLTESIVSDEQTLQKRALRLYGQKGNALINLLYRLRKGDWGYLPSSEMNTIEAWPLPDVNEVLALGHKTLPSLAFVSNGITAWHGRYENTSGAYVEFGEITDRQKLLSELPRWSLSGKVWPGQHNIGLDKKEIEEKVTLLRNDNSPQEIGLHFDVTISESVSAKTGVDRIESTYWIDSARDDMVVDEIYREYKQGQKSVEHQTRYLDYAQLDNGQWYPTHWQTTITGYSSGGPEQIAIFEYYLRMYPEMRLDDWWFTSLVDNLKAQQKLTLP